jgi:hypothetical protein
MASNTLRFDITTEDKQTLAALRNIQRELKATGTDAEQTATKGKKSGDALSKAMKGVAIAAVGRFALGEAEEAQQTEARTAAVIKSTGNAAEISAAQQDKMVDSLSKIAAVDDEVIAGGANMLRTFTNIKGQAFEPALAAATDLSAAMGTDLQSAVIQVGKALNDPAKGLTKLQRIGVTFTDQQKDQVKALQASGDTLGAQKVIIAELNKEFGGSAEAMATDSARLKVTMQNLGEDAGKALLPIVKGVTNVAERFTELPHSVQTGVAAIGVATVAANKLAERLGEESGLGAKISATTSVIGPAAIAAVGLGIGYQALGSQAETSAKNVTKLVDAIAAGVDPLEAWNQELAATIAGTKGGFDLRISGDDFRAGVDEIGISTKQLSKNLTGSQKDFQAFLDEIATNHPDADNILRTLSELRRSYFDARRKGKDLAEAQKDLGLKTKAAAGDLDQGAGSSQKMASAQDKAKVAAVLAGDALKRETDHLGELIKKQEDQAGNASDAFSASQSLASSKQDVIDKEKALEEARKKGDPVAIAAAERDLAAAMKTQADDAVALADANAKVAGRTLTASEKAAIFDGVLQKVRKQTGYWDDDLATLTTRTHNAAAEVDYLNKKLIENLQIRQVAAYNAFHPGSFGPGQGELSGRPTGAPHAPGVTPGGNGTPFGEGGTATTGTIAGRALIHADHLHVGENGAELEHRIRVAEGRQGRRTLVTTR